MNTHTLKGAEAEALVQEQIHKQSIGIDDALSVLDPRSAVSAWMDALRGVEELINVPLFELEDEKATLALVGLRLDSLTPMQVKQVREMLVGEFEVGVADRFVQTILMSAAIGRALREHGMDAGEAFRTLGGVISYFQSRRRQMVALLYCMPLACRGTTRVEPLDAMNLFMPLVELNCVALTNLYRHSVLLRIYDAYELTVDQRGFSASHELDLLDDSFLEPERAGLTEVSRDRVDARLLSRRMRVDAGKVFSVPELCNDLLIMEATYVEFGLGSTEFGAMARFIVACSQGARDDYYIEIGPSALAGFMDHCGLSAAARRHLVYAGTGYVDAINSFSPFIVVDGRYVTTVTLLSRFAYSWKSTCLNRIKRFQIRSGFIFEQQVKDALREQGFEVSDVKRIERKEFDVIATKDGVIYNVQCKNNLIDLTRIEGSPALFARYNKKLERYYVSSLRKEEGREELLKQRFGLGVVKHVVLSKFPVATQKRRILSFRQISQFGERFES